MEELEVHAVLLQILVDRRDHHLAHAGAHLVDHIVRVFAGNSQHGHQGRAGAEISLRPADLAAPIGKTQVVERAHRRRVDRLLRSAVALEPGPGVLLVERVEACLPDTISPHALEGSQGQVEHDGQATQFVVKVAQRCGVAEHQHANALGGQDQVAVRVVCAVVVGHHLFDVCAKRLDPVGDVGKRGGGVSDQPAQEAGVAIMRGWRPALGAGHKGCTGGDQVFADLAREAQRALAQRFVTERAILSFEMDGPHLPSVHVLHVGRVGLALEQLEHVVMPAQGVVATPQQFPRFVIAAKPHVKAVLLAAHAHTGVTVASAGTLAADAPAELVDRDVIARRAAGLLLAHQFGGRAQRGHAAAKDGNTGQGGLADHSAHFTIRIGKGRPSATREHRREPGPCQCRPALPRRWALRARR